MSKRKTAEISLGCSEVLNPQNYADFMHNSSCGRAVKFPNHEANDIEADIFNVRLNGQPFYDFFAMELEKEAAKIQEADVSDVSLSLTIVNADMSDVGSDISTDSEAPLDVVPLRMYFPVEQVNWTVKKILTGSDCNAQHRLLIHKKPVLDHIICHLDQESQLKINTADGLRVNVLDCDTGNLVKLTLKRWPSSTCYGLMSNWRRDIVCRRGLKAGDEVGISWDKGCNRLLFTVLGRSVGPPSVKRSKKEVYTYGV